MPSLIEFESAQPFAARFFREALAGSHLAHAYIFCGKDLGAMYRLALRLAQIVNCLQPDPALPDGACGQCQPCRWIETNAHPDVITLTNLTYLMDVNAETGAVSASGKARKTISVGQLESLLQHLNLHSGGFRRVVIVAGAQEVSRIASQGEQYGLIPPPGDWRPTEEGAHLQLLPLDRRLFPDVLANKFLKTLEEPPGNVLFILLTDSEDKLLETIVSRCQSVPFITPADFYDVSLTTEARAAFSEMLARFSSGSEGYLQQTQHWLALMKELGLDSETGLATLQAFLWQQAREQNIVGDKTGFRQTKRLLKALDQARLMIRDHVKEDWVLENLFLTRS